MWWDHIEKLSRLTSLGCGQHLTSETCFFSQEHAHFGAHTTQLCISLTLSKKDFRSTSLFFSRFLNSWLVVWSPRPERIDNVAGMRTAPRDNSAPCTVQVVCRHGALDLMPPLCPNRQERRCNPPFSTRMSRLTSCAASGKWSAASEAHSLCGCIPRDSY